MAKLIEATNRHVVFLSKVCLEAAKLYNPLIPGAFDHQSEKFLKDGIPNSYDIRIIVHNGEPVGFIGEVYLESGNHYLTALYFLKKYQRMGIGSKVHQQLIGELREERVKSSVLFVHQKADWAIAFYKKLGYRIINNTKNGVIEFDSSLENYYLPNTYFMKLDVSSVVGIDYSAK